MKKFLIFWMLILSTSIAMAQFGSLKDLKDKEKQGEGGSGFPTDIPSMPNNNALPNQFGDAQLIEKCITDGFFLVRQEYQLEEKSNPGSRYNWGDEQFFDYGVSFVVRLTNGFITTNSIVSPWTEEGEEENKFTQYQNTHNPVFSKTSIMKLGQKGWKTENKVFQPMEESELYRGLKFVKDDEWAGEGFLRASGYGKKEVYLIWMIVDNDQQEYKSISFQIECIEVDIEHGMNSCEATVPEKPYHVHAIGGIVVEPVYKSIGQIELALVGVVDNEHEGIDPINGWPVSISLLEKNMSEGISPDGDKALTPTEGSDSGDKKSNTKSSK